MSVAESPHRQNVLSREERDQVRKHLRSILSSRAFVRSPRARDFLDFVVRNALAGNYSNLRERMIGAQIFGRSVDYDTGSDSVVRVMATEVRKRLKQFYMESPAGNETVAIELPSGSYVPVFVFTHRAEQESVVSPQVPLVSADPAPDAVIEPIPNVAAAEQPVAISDPVPAEDVDATPILHPAVAVQAQKSRHLGRWGVAILLVCAFAAGAYKLWTALVPGKRPIRSVVVLPMKNLSGDSNEDFFADGMTAELINDLGQNSNLRVISLTSSMNLKQSTKMIPEIARDLNVEGVIEGSVQREGDRVRINIELVDGREDRPVWAQTYLRATTGILNLQADIAADITKRVSSSVPRSDQGRPVSKHLVSPEAHTAYLHGLLLLEAERDQDAYSYFRQAVQADSQFAEAHSALAECIGRMAVSGLKPNREAFVAQKAEALQAISLDPKLAEPHAELADSVMALDWDWQTASTEYQRALELNPNSAAIHQKYAIFRVFQAQTADAIRQVDIGADLDPTSAVAVRNQLFVYFFARKYDKVLSVIETAHSMGMDPPGSYFFRGAIFAQLKQYDASIEWFQKASKSPHSLGHLGAVYAFSGRKLEAVKTIATLEADVQQQGIGQYEIALVYAALGDKKSAIQWLGRAADAHDVGLLYIKVDPFLDSLRNEPEFQNVVRRTGLPV